MENYSIYIAFVVMLFMIKWSNQIASKVPSWLNQDWRNQATTFLSENKDAEDPDISISPAPSFSWLSPFSHNIVQHKHKLWWIPFVGSILDKDWRSLWCEVLVSTLTVLMASIIYLSAKNDNVDTLRFIFGFVFILMLQTMSTIDHRTQFLPDILTYPFLWLGLVYSTASSNLITPALSIEGAILGFMMLWGLNFIYKALKKIDGMGGGDMKLLAGLGAWTGPTGVILILFLASFIGLFHAIMLIILRKPFNKFAFGPSLATAGVVVFIFHPFLVDMIKTA